MGTLFIISTPIGNLADISIRALQTMFTVDIIACEDTRRTGMLLTEVSKKYGGLLTQLQHPRKPTLLRYDDRTETYQTPILVNHLKQNQSVALVTDAGTPLISDPGYRIVTECIKAGISVIPVPGASAVTAALTKSGLAVNQYIFLGYPPEKQGHRLKFLTELKKVFQGTADIKPLCVFYIAPHKFRQMLTDVQTVYGDISVTVARELTKIHEETFSSRISNILTDKAEVKGEIVLLFPGADALI